MRWLLIALLAGCGGTFKCDSPCAGGRESLIYLCDGGPCLAGEANAAAYLQCVCGTGHLLVVEEPTHPSACFTVQDQWNAFYATNCR